MTQEELAKVKDIARDIAKQEIAKALAALKVPEPAPAVPVHPPVVEKPASVSKRHGKK